MTSIFDPTYDNFSGNHVVSSNNLKFNLFTKIIKTLFCASLPDDSEDDEPKSNENRYRDFIIV